jgi:hypothetical protein
MGQRPIVSAAITSNEKAVACFVDLAGRVTQSDGSIFSRSTGDAALEQLQLAAAAFESMHLQA